MSSLNPHKSVIQTMKVGQLERATQQRVVQLFQQKLGYRYLGQWEDRAHNRNVEVALLRDFHYHIQITIRAKAVGGGRAKQVQFLYLVFFT